MTDHQAAPPQFSGTHSAKRSLLLRGAQMAAEAAGTRRADNHSQREQEQVDRRLRPLEDVFGISNSLQIMLD
jgi:hypothetical protein